MRVRELQTKDVVLKLLPRRQRGVPIGIRATGLPLVLRRPVAGNVLSFGLAGSSLLMLTYVMRVASHPLPLRK